MIGPANGGIDGVANGVDGRSETDGNRSSRDTKGSRNRGRARFSRDMRIIVGFHGERPSRDPLRSISVDIGHYIHGNVIAGHGARSGNTHSHGASGDGDGTGDNERFYLLVVKGLDRQARRAKDARILRVGLDGGPGGESEFVFSDQVRSGSSPNGRPDTDGSADCNGAGSGNDEGLDGSGVFGFNRQHSSALKGAVVQESFRMRENHVRRQSARPGNGHASGTTEPCRDGCGCRDRSNARIRIGKNLDVTNGALNPGGGVFNVGRDIAANQVSRCRNADGDRASCGPSQRNRKGSGSSDRIDLRLVARGQGDAIG